LYFAEHFGRVLKEQERGYIMNDEQIRDKILQAIYDEYKNKESFLTKIPSYVLAKKNRSGRKRHGSECSILGGQGTYDGHPGTKLFINSLDLDSHLVEFALVRDLKVVDQVQAIRFDYVLKVP